MFPGTAGSEFERIYRTVARDRNAMSFSAYYPDHGRWYDINGYPAEDGALTGHSQEKAKLAAEAAGFDGLFAKPLDINKLLDVLRDRARNLMVDTFCTCKLSQRALRTYNYRK